MGEENFKISMAPPSLSLSGMVDRCQPQHEGGPGKRDNNPFRFSVRTSAYILNIQCGITSALMVLGGCMYISQVKYILRILIRFTNFTRP